MLFPLDIFKSAASILFNGIEISRHRGTFWLTCFAWRTLFFGRCYTRSANLCALVNLMDAAIPEVRTLIDKSIYGRCFTWSMDSWLRLVRSIFSRHHGTLWLTFLVGWHLFLGALLYQMYELLCLFGFIVFFTRFDGQHHNVCVSASLTFPVRIPGPTMN